MIPVIPMMMIRIPPRDTSPHQDSAGTAPSGTPPPAQPPPPPQTRKTVPQLSLYKILFHFKAFLWAFIILFLPPPHLQRLPYCNAITRLHCNIRPPPTPPPLYAIHHTLLVMEILCEGQPTARQRRYRRGYWRGAAASG